MYKNILFDLDGTLLPLDTENFIKLYFGSLCKRFVPVLKVAPETLVNAVWKGMTAMVKNDNTMLNKDVFWSVCSAACGMDLYPYIDQFADYYLTEFIETKQATRVNPLAKKCVDLVNSRGKKVIVATNPVFPEVATLRRLNWAGITPDDFDYFTVYENSGCCKPNLEYYRMICDKCGINPEESIMIGNDVDEDMCASALGFDTYLVTDCLINRTDKDISEYKHGTFAQLYSFLSENLKAE